MIFIYTNCPTCGERIKFDTFQNTGICKFCDTVLNERPLTQNEISQKKKLKSIIGYILFPLVIITFPLSLIIWFIAHRISTNAKKRKMQSIVDTMVLKQSDYLFSKDSEIGKNQQILFIRQCDVRLKIEKDGISFVTWITGNDNWFYIVYDNGAIIQTGGFNLSQNQFQEIRENSEAFLSAYNSMLEANALNNISFDINKELQIYIFAILKACKNGYDYLKNYIGETDKVALTKTMHTGIVDPIIIRNLFLDEDYIKELLDDKKYSFNMPRYEVLKKIEQRVLEKAKYYYNRKVQHNKELIEKYKKEIIKDFEIPVNFNEVENKVISRSEKARLCFFIWQERVKAQEEYENQQWRLDYENYLKSEQWNELRKECYKRDGGKCVDCGKTIQLSQAECHHLYYKDYSEGGAFATELSDIVLLCGDCHKKYKGTKKISD